MADEDKHRDPLWMFERRAPGPRPQDVAYDEADALYTLYRNTRNPFVQRAIAPGERPQARSAEELQRLSGFLARHGGYRVGPSNAADPYQRRSLPHPSPPPQARPAWLGPERLQGSPQRLPWMVNLFFQAVLERLRADPQAFFAVVHELAEQFRADNVRIRVYDAYHTLRDWDDLMDTLEEIARYPSPETFDLFCSALFAYYDLVEPPAQR